METIPLETYFELLTSSDMRTLSTVSSSLRERTTDDFVWRILSAREGLLLPTPPSPITTQCAWREALFHLCPVSPGSFLSALSRGVLSRSQAIWRTLASFSAQHGIDPGLLPGVSGAAIATAETRLKVRFPHSLRAFLSVHGGQRNHGLHGLLGGAIFGYHSNHPTTSLLHRGLSGLVDASQYFHEKFGLPSSFVVIALGPVCHVMDCSDASPTNPGRGALYAFHNGLIIPSCRGARPLHKSLRAPHEGPLEDALLEWLEVYTQELLNGLHKVEVAPSEEEEEEVEDQEEEEDEEVEGQEGGVLKKTKSAPKPCYIAAWRESGPGTSHAVTAGIHVQISSHLLLPLSRAPEKWGIKVSDWDREGGGVRVAKILALWPQTQGGEDDNTTGSNEGQLGVEAEATSARGSSNTSGGGAPLPPPSSLSSSKSSLTYTYRVRLWRDEGAPHAFPGDFSGVRLRSREWRMVEEVEGGKKEGVKGPGVVGLFPLLRRGHPTQGKPFTYTSATSFSQLPGSMEGEFFFEKEGEGEGEGGGGTEFPVHVGRFVMGEHVLPQGEGDKGGKGPLWIFS